MTGACASLDIKVHTDYDPAADFSKYETYSWIERPRTGNPLMEERMIQMVDTQLSAKGWRRVVAGPSDVALGVRVTTKEQERVDTFYTGWGGDGHRGLAQSEVLEYGAGTIIVDMFDARTKQPVWRGVATDAVADDPWKNTAPMRKALDKLFQGFPPKPAGH
jgi:hypothetical protein